MRRFLATRIQSPLIGIAASILLVAATLAVLVHFGAQEEVVRLLRWVDAQGEWAPLLFILVMAAAVVLVVPGVLLTTGAGFVFGVLKGTIYVVVGTTLGATISFLIARYLFGQRARQFIVTRTRLRLVIEELTPRGWKIVLLTRLIPFFPGKLSNYFFGMTRFSLLGYVFASLLGFIPFSIHNVFLGSIAADISTLGGRSLDRSPVEWTLYGAGFVALVIAIIYLNHLARRALALYTGQGSIREDEP